MICENDNGSAIAEKIYNITGTADAKTKFGSKVHDLVKILINNNVSNIKCISIGTYGTEMSNKYSTVDAAYDGAFQLLLAVRFDDDIASNTFVS